jgi:hypothetical protein
MQQKVTPAAQELHQDSRGKKTKTHEKSFPTERGAIPELGLGADFIGGPQLHTVDLGLLISGSGQSPPNHLVLMKLRRHKAEKEDQDQKALLKRGEAMNYRGKKHQQRGKQENLRTRKFAIAASSQEFREQGAVVHNKAAILKP